MSQGHDRDDREPASGPVVGPDPLPSTGGSGLTPFLRGHDRRAVPQRGVTLLLSGLGTLLVLAVLAWLTLR